MVTGTVDGERAKVASDLLKALSHPARLRLACRVAEGECSVAVLEQELGIRQPALSQHLGELREAGLVTTRREHKHVFYTLTDPRALAILEALEDAFSGTPRRPGRRPEKRCGLLDGAAVFAVVGERS